MISLRPSLTGELPEFLQFDQQPHASNFVLQIDLSVHEGYFQDPNITYLTILRNEEKAVGYFILVQESANNSVEFRRIVIDQNETGIGQLAIEKMEQYCQDSLSAKRIWLDVFDDNHKGIHIYEKLGYQFFKNQDYEGRNLLLYEKFL